MHPLRCPPFSILRCILARFRGGRPALAVLGLTVWLNSAAAATTASAPPRLNYGADIRPILAENCFYCHGQDESRRKGKLRLDTRAGQLSQDAVIPGKAGESELIFRILSEDPEERMPPLDSHRTLSAAQKDLLRRWIDEGAHFESHWAFSAPTRPSLPGVRVPRWVRNPIDTFVLAKLESSGLTPSPEADKATLLRRVSLDLTGLPPTPAEADAFITDRRPDAYERLVDRLLASPRYGERMALPWLDAARYADSNGFQQDGDTFQWIWRDWVVRALNANMPFDQFTIEQLAGDLLPQATTDQRIATAFNRNHLLNGEGGVIPEEQRFVTLFDRVDTTSTNWLGLTVACAQCHDHKYDPVSQKDYYSLMAAFNQLPETGNVKGSPSKVRVAEPLLSLATPEHLAELAALEAKLATVNVNEKIGLMLAAWQPGAEAQPAALPKAVRDVFAVPVAERERRHTEVIRRHFIAVELPKIDPEFHQLFTRRDFLKYDGNPRVMVMEDSMPRTTHVLDRGNYESPREPVTFATPSFLPPLPADAPRNRLGLARWLVSPEQPLTARVMANRHWQTFFGLGLVKTSEDFGVQSEPPVHRELLDWLAVEYRERGWDTKHLHRLIVTSATYRQSSVLTPALKERDPENRLFARGARFRLPAMLIRDQALAVSGLLVEEIGGKPVYPYQPADIWDSLAITLERDFTYPHSTGRDLYRRSLYTFWRRTIAPSNLFDASSRNTCQVRSATTSTPLHALTTLNDPTYIEAARALAGRVLTTEKKPDARLAAAFRAVLARAPDRQEKAILQASLAKQQARFRADPASAAAFLAVGEKPPAPGIAPAEHAAYAAVCLALLNLDETLTKS